MNYSLSKAIFYVEIAKSSKIKHIKIFQYFGLRISKCFDFFIDNIHRRLRFALHGSVSDFSGHRVQKLLKQTKH